MNDNLLTWSFRGTLDVLTALKPVRQHGLQMYIRKAVIFQQTSRCRCSTIRDGAIVCPPLLSIVELGCAHLEVCYTLSIL